jgi:subtilisin family serine protease
MPRLKNFAISLFILAVLALPLTTSSQNQENSPRSSPQTSRPEAPQDSRRSQTKFGKRPNAIPNRYIVVLNDDVADDDHPREVRLERVTEIANSHAVAHLGRVDYIYETALKGYAIELPNEAAAVAISNRPQVQWVEEDYRLELAQAPASPQSNPPWGLDAIDGNMPVAAPDATGRTNGLYLFNGTGAGVNAYVIDSGINTAHVQFQTAFGNSRASQAADCIRNNDCRTGPPSQFIDGACGFGMPNTINNDCSGHGTHVAGILGGNTVGVAKGVNIRSIKVCVVPSITTPVDCPASAIIGGVNWVTSEHQASSATPKVVNMSLAAPDSLPFNPPFFNNSGIDSAVTNSINNGVTYVIAAGNANRDASTFHPGTIPAALTVGAVDWTGNRWIMNDSQGSNYGPRVDLFAPGVFVVSAQTGNQLPGDCFIWNGSNTSECRATGTSMAAPHVAGAVAMYMQNRSGLNNCTFPIDGPAPPLNANLSTCPDRIARYLKANANRDRLTNSINGILRNANGTPILAPNGSTIPVFSPNLFLWNISVPTLPNPLENHRFFVWEQYNDFLNRDPDSGGFNNWLAVLNACPGSDWPCINAGRIHMVRGFIESGEFKNGIPNLANPPSTAAYNEEYVRQLYLRLLRRPVDPVGLATWVGHLNSTGDYNHVVHGIINAAEYRVRFGPH